MSKPKEPTSGHDLFPDAWIVGKAAASLDSDDTRPIVQQAPLLNDGPLPDADDLTDLKQDIEQLHQRVADTQARIKPIDEQINELGATLTALRDAPDRQVDALQAEIARIGAALTDHVRRQRRANRLHTLLLLIVLGLGTLTVLSDFGGAPAGEGVSQTVESTLQRVRAWVGDLRDALASGDAVAQPDTTSR